MQVWSRSSWGWNSRKKSGWSPRASNCCCQLKVPGSVYSSQWVAIMQTYFSLGLLTKCMFFTLMFVTLISFLLRIFWNNLLSFVSAYWRNWQVDVWGSASWRISSSSSLSVLNLVLKKFYFFNLVLKNVYCSTWLRSETHAEHTVITIVLPSFFLPFYGQVSTGNKWIGLEFYKQVERLHVKILI